MTEPDSITDRITEIFTKIFEEQIKMKVLLHLHDKISKNIYRVIINCIHDIQY